MTEDQLRDYVRKTTKSAAHNGEAAKMVGCSRSQFVNFLAGRKRPGKRMLRRLGLERQLVYVPRVKRGTKAG